MTPKILSLAEELIDRAKARGWRLATAESCTGGLVAAALTEIPGSSAVLERGFVVYSNAAKTELLGVDPALIAAHGAVSEEVARAMAEGAWERAPVDCTVSITGIAGPGGATATKPEGLVHFAVAAQGVGTRGLRREHGAIGRTQVRQASVETALRMLLDALV